MRFSTSLRLAAVAVLLAAARPSHAQISITQGDMPVIGDTLRVSRGVADTALNYQQTGANQTWNYASLIPLSQQVYSFGSVAATGLIFQFTFGPLGGANQANLTAPVNLPLDSLPGGGGGLMLQDITGFFRKTAQQYKQVGYGASLNGIQVPVTYQTGQQDIVYRLPLTFNAVDSSSSAFQVDVPNTAFLAQSQKRVNRCDGWGTLTTPFGTFPTIRVNTTLDTYDSLALSGQQPIAIQIPTRHEYKWLATGQHIPLLTISTAVVAGTELVTGVEWRDIYRHITLPSGAPADRALVAVTAAPNPLAAEQPLTLRGLPATGATVEVLDALGRHLLTRTVAGETATLIAADLRAAHGVLLLRVTTAAGEVAVRRLMRD